MRNQKSTTHERGLVLVSCVVVISGSVGCGSSSGGSQSKMDGSSGGTPNASQDSGSGSGGFSGGAGGNSTGGTVNRSPDAGRRGAGAGPGPTADSGAGAGAGSMDSGTGSDAKQSSLCSVSVTTTSALCATAGTCAVLVDATMTCSEPDPLDVSVAAGTADRAFLTLTARTPTQVPFHPQLFTIDPAGGSTVESDPIAAARLRVAADTSGTPYLFGDEVGGNAVSYASRRASGWVSRIISPTDSTQYFVNGAAIAADGRTMALFAGNDLGSIYLATRTTTGAWTDDVVTPSHLYGGQSLTLDGAGQSYVAYTVADAGLVQFFFRAGTATPVSVFSYASATASNKIDIAAPGGGSSSTAPVMAADLNSTGNLLHVFVPRAGSPYGDVVAAATTVSDPAGCAPSAACSTTHCTETAESTFAGAHALAATSDGTVFFAYTHRHIDRDAHYVLLSGGVPVCNKVIDADRSTTEVVIARVPVASGTSLAEAFRADAGNLDGDVELDMAARNERLYLAVLGSSGARYLMLDATKMP